MFKSVVEKRISHRPFSWVVCASCGGAGAMSGSSGLPTGGLGALIVVTPSLLPPPQPAARLTATIAKAPNKRVTPDVIGFESVTTVVIGARSPNASVEMGAAGLGLCPRQVVDALEQREASESAVRTEAIVGDAGPASRRYGFYLPATDET